MNCQNREEFQDQRQKAVRQALDRNEDAFKVSFLRNFNSVGMYNFYYYN